MADHQPGPTNDQTIRRFGRFIVVGVINTGFGFLVYALLVLLGFPAQVSLAIAFVIGVLWNYWTHARYVFDNKGLAKLPAYAASYVAIYLFNSLSLGVLLRTGLGPLLAQAILAPIAAILSFVLISRVLTGAFPFVGKRAG